MVCDGSGGSEERPCAACDNDGHWELKTCPKEFVGADTWSVIEYAELCEKGLPPVAGGMLDQSRWFIEAARRVWQEQAYWRTKLGISSGN